LERPVLYLPKLKTRVAIVNEMVTDIAVVKDRGRQWWRLLCVWY